MIDWAQINRSAGAAFKNAQGRRPAWKTAGEAIAEALAEEATNDVPLPETESAESGRGVLSAL